MVLVSIVIAGTAAAHAMAADRVANWNVTAAAASAMAGQNGVVSSRTLAMVQSAVHDALNAIDRRYELRRFFHHDSIEFTTTSGAPFAGITRSFVSFSDAAEENGNSRIYAGIHFRSAVRDGIAQGKQIGRFVFSTR
jgi:hypothetical protein